MAPRPLDPADPDMHTKAMCLTSVYHKTPYPALSSAQPIAKGKYVLITGASQGLGYHMAKAWAKGGAAGIAICARTSARLEPVVAEIKSINPDTETLAMACDTTKPSQVEALFTVTKEKFGKLDVVIANVGAGSRGLNVGEADPEQWWNDMATNLRSAHLTSHYFIATFGPAPIGTLITLTSGAAGIVPPGLSSYGIAKQACIRLAEFLDAEHPTLRVFALDPGIVRTVAMMPSFVLYAVIEPELVGQFSVWLASEKSEGLRGGFANVAWDVEELEEYGELIRKTGLVKSKFLAGVTGQEGGAFKK
ncbi:NAD(P)-binding protein [Setomelanomma holmii]|uniref:NAD(P)-binding protein n=1 Tax=Setomelanomma holmii TaxID=210430 RepID=A0A9P4LLK3_9PLEO|nr:NAD(P)-binding protein [Setomelanomma holmii]